MTTQDEGAGFVVRGDAVTIPLRHDSVDLIVTSPPYYSLRRYEDGETVYDGQVGMEPTPGAFLEALWAVVKECWRVLNPDGSLFVNLGDKRSGSGGHNNSNISKHGEKRGPKSYNKAAFGRSKSRMMLPERFAIGCMDGAADPQGIGWVHRQTIIWRKKNSTPESVKDRTRDDYEVIYHFTKSERYYANIDEIRVPHKDDSLGSLGALPSSVWDLPMEPFKVPEHVQQALNLPEHFAAFPSAIPWTAIKGFAPPAGVVLDPFGGTGTTALTARVLGRVGISLDLSHDYSRLAKWRVSSEGQGVKVLSNNGAAKTPKGATVEMEVPVPYDPTLWADSV